MVSITKKIEFQIAGIWLFLRGLTSLAAAAFAPLFASTTFEKEVPIWPMIGGLFVWLQRVFVAPWVRWDVVYYGLILTQGYRPWDGTTAFHPLFPWLSLPLYWLGLDPTLSLLIVSSLAALALFYAFYRLALLDLDPGKARMALLFLATFPVSFILFTPYTEGLFLLWTALALLAMRRQRWGLAALAICLAGLSRQQGLFLGVPLAWYAWEASGKSMRGIPKAWRAWLALLSAPAGLVAWAAYRIGYLHEGSFNFSSPQALIYSALLSPSSSLVVKGQSIRWPWEALWVGVSALVHKPEINIITNLALAVVFLGMFIAAWRYLDVAGRLYSVTVILVSFSMTTGDVAYMSLPRHLMLALPVFIGLAAAVQKPWLKKTILVVQILWYLFLLLLFILTNWIP